MAAVAERKNIVIDLPVNVVAETLYTIFQGLCLDDALVFSSLNL